MKEDIKHPRFIVRYLDENCVVELYDKDNILILQQPMIDEDPYMFISRLRESVDGAHISEDPRLKCVMEEKEQVNPFVKVIDNQIEMLTELREQMVAYTSSIRKHFVDDEGQEPERSFTDNLD